ncbi:unannotated protein [freshwater metagenome]|uniref:Unannotated protein n=1 Tax=freshwater metagenome TaxID=449393 RepID=A0A6J6IFI6_9ZZZZ
MAGDRCVTRLTGKRCLREMAGAILKQTEIDTLKDDEIHADTRDLDPGHRISGLGDG